MRDLHGRRVLADFELLGGVDLLGCLGARGRSRLFARFGLFDNFSLFIGFSLPAQFDLRLLRPCCTKGLPTELRIKLPCAYGITPMNRS